MIKIDSIEQFQQALRENERFFLLKHSTTCPISQEAYEEYESHSQNDNGLKHYFLTVQDARPLSNHIAEAYHVKHESPQAILFNREAVAWHDSHWKITTKTLAKAVEEN